jgi:hypothetical protein
MSPKKRILRELSLIHEPGTTYSYVRPADIPGYAEAPELFQKAVNELLKERLIEGRPDGEGRISIGVNEHRMRDVRKVLRPLWARPEVWAAVAIVVALGVGLAG